MDTKWAACKPTHPPPATIFPHLTAATFSSHHLERGLNLRSWGRTTWTEIPEAIFGKVEKSRGWQASEELTYNKPINLLSIRLSFLDFNEIGWQWCLSNGMELSDMSGFIDRISYQDYDTCVHTSEPGHFFRLACGQKRVIESPPSRGSLFWFGGRGLFCPLFFFGNKKEQFQSPSLYPAFTPSFFFTIFLTHFAEKYIMKQHHSSLFSLSDGESGGTDCPE